MLFSPLRLHYSRAEMKRLLTGKNWQPHAWSPETPQYRRTAALCVWRNRYPLTLPKHTPALNDDRGEAAYDSAPAQSSAYLRKGGGNLSAFGDETSQKTRKSGRLRDRR